MEAQFFDTPAELRAWFEQHHESAPELFVGYWKKGSGRIGVTHPQAIEQALCFGWIDSIGRSIDNDSYQVRFTPRRKGSVWSAVNIAKIAELTEAGLMAPAGLHAFEQRRPDRVAVYSYEQPADAVFDDAQTARFRAEGAAWEWFSAQTPSYRRAAVHWVVSAKRADTRERRLTQLITDSAAGRKVPPLTPR
ncbi:YdeI/OmpD-associated family protein [Actinoplanes bogorensis]|uniref:YdeI/OmpD-associated family protein n=1 Tax=Paractinoplanes bogorensis TaxID=1610840 RepID=A0ABS5Z4L4_9ACTN|nr:YdeI/OmpD-associated family protein [Actinoplanes bogorensis]MBU2670628.1 YdeI/OmpD-associated family protein [Actinoplanes bogorensis]